MAKITPESIANLKALFQDNEKALGANFSQLIDFFNNNKVTDNGDGTFTVGTVTVDASKLYDLINNSSPNILPLDNEFTGKNTFDIAPINKANGKPYITEDSVPPVDLSNYPTKDQLATKADDSKVVHTTGAEEVSGQKTFDTAPIDKTTGNPYITKSDVTTAISAATANMADTTKAANFTNGLQSGGVNVATAADLKSVKDSAWREVTSSYFQGSYLFRDNQDGTVSLAGTIYFANPSQKYNGFNDYIIILPDGYKATGIIGSESIDIVTKEFLRGYIYMDDVFSIGLSSYFPGKAFHVYQDGSEQSNAMVLPLHTVRWDNNNGLSGGNITLKVTKTS